MKPRKLYKYTAYTSYSIENLKNNAIYFNIPERFNDLL